MGYKNPDISLWITDDVTVRRLNKLWRGKDRTTDVLSFSQQEGEGPVTPHLGDIVISSDAAMRQAAQLGHSLIVETTCLLVHGTLHLVGYDHVHGGHQARRMRQEEARVLALLARDARLGFRKELAGLLSR